MNDAVAVAVQTKGWFKIGTVAACKSSQFRLVYFLNMDHRFSQTTVGDWAASIPLQSPLDL